MKEEIYLYTTHCPKCKILERKLNEKQIAYSEITDVDTMRDLGIVYVPVLSVAGKLLQFSAAVDWVNKQGGVSV